MLQASWELCVGKRDPNPYWFNIEIFAVIASNTLKIRQVFSAVFSLYRQKSLVLNCSHLPMRCFSQDFSAAGCRQAWRLSNPTSWKIAKTSIVRQCVFESRLPRRKRRIRTILLIGSCKCFLFLLAQTGSAVALNSLTKNKKHSPSPYAQFSWGLEHILYICKIHSRRACFANI